MNPSTTPDLKQGLEQFSQFLAGNSPERLFTWSTCHPSHVTGFCPCDRAWPSVLWFYFKSTLLLTALKLPFNTLKIALLRWSGAKVGRNVFISADVWIDPAFPELLTIEEEVMLGVGARIILHSFERDYFEAGRVLLRKQAIIGGCAIIGHGVEIGEGAVVATGAVVRHDVPAGKAAVGNPAQITFLTRPGNSELQTHE